AARVISKLGVLTGRVPRSARRSLARQSFRQFCRFQVDAERTAEIAWGRLEALGGEHAETFGRIAAEEGRHRRAFAALAAAFTEEDALEPTTAPAALDAELATIDPSFVAPPDRRQHGRVGQGGRVVVSDQAEASA